MPRGTFGAGNQRIGRQDGTDRAFGSRPVGDLQVEPIEAPEPAEAPLRGRDVDYADALVGTDPRQRAGNVQFGHMPVCRDLQRVANLAAARSKHSGGQEQRIFVKDWVARFIETFRPYAEQRWRDARGADHVQPEQREADGARARFKLHDRARICNPGCGRDVRVESLVEAERGGCANRQISGTIDATHRLIERRQRRAVDEVHCKAERDTDRDGNCRQRQPRRVPAPLAADQPAERQPCGQDART